jgi:hypothetical protein
MVVGGFVRDIRDFVPLVERLSQSCEVEFLLIGDHPDDVGDLELRHYPVVDSTIRKVRPMPLKREQFIIQISI